MNLEGIVNSGSGMNLEGYVARFKSQNYCDIGNNLNQHSGQSVSQSLSEWATVYMQYRVLLLYQSACFSHWLTLHTDRCINCHMLARISLLNYCKLLKLWNWSNSYNRKKNIFLFYPHLCHECPLFSIDTRHRAEIISDTICEKVKVKYTLVQAVRPIGGVEVHLYPFMTTALEWVEGSASHPGRSLPPGKTRYLLYRRLGGPQGQSGQVRKIRPNRYSIPGPSSR